MIHVSYRGRLAELTGCSGEQIEAARVSDVLNHIKKRYGVQAHREANRHLIAVDRKSITLLDGRRTVLPEGCTVGFLPICGGG